MIDRDRTFHRLMAATRKREAEDRHAREALPRTTSIPQLLLSVAASAERKSVIHVSGRFCWVKVNGQWLYKTPDRDWKE